MSRAYHCRQNSGVGVLGVIGSLGLLLVVLAGSLNAIMYHEMKQRLQTLASSGASVAATFLPNASRACLKATDYINDAKALVLGDAMSTITVRMFALRVDANGDQIAGRLSLGADTCTMPAFTATGRIKTLIISLRGSVTTPFFPGLVSLPAFDIVAEATAELTPTDVVLVIDNSNSVVSPMITIAETTGGNWQDLLDWDDWEGEPILTTTSPDDGSVISMSKAELYGDQCFGDVTLTIKKAALKIYDTLTASGSFRVGVVHTTKLSMTGTDETIGLTDYPYAVKALPTFSLAGPGDTYGITDYPQTRCAAMTGDPNLLPVPAHPLSSHLFEALNTDLSGQLRNRLPGPNADDEFVVSARPIDNPQFKPRDLIWINSAGVNGSSGLDARFDSAQIPLAVMKAAQMLETAPARADEAPVRKRMIIVLTDGLDSTSANTGISTWSELSTFSATSTVHGVIDSTTIHLQEYRSTDFPVGYCESSHNPLSPYFYPATANNIDQKRNLLQLGIALFDYPAVLNFPSTHPLRYLNKLYGHGQSQAARDLRAAHLAASCAANTWEPQSGIFMVSSTSVIDFVDGAIDDLIRATLVGTTGL